MSESEKRVKGIWSEVFGRSDIAVTDNFFEIGGDSIKGMQIFTRLNQQLCFIEVSDFLNIRQSLISQGRLIMIIVGRNKKVEEMKESRRYAMSPMQQGMFFHDMLTEDHIYYEQVSLISRGN